MIKLKLVPRVEPSRPMLLVAPLLAVFLTLVVGLGIFAALGQNPLHAFHAFFIEPVSTANGISELLLKASPLCLIALGLAIGYRANIWNIGAEGQMYLGGIFATGLSIHFGEAGGVWLLPVMVVAGAMGLPHRVMPCAVSRQRDSGQPDAVLRRRPAGEVPGIRPVAGPAGQ